MEKKNEKSDSVLLWKKIISCEPERTAFVFISKKLITKEKKKTLNPKVFWFRKTFHFIRLFNFEKSPAVSLCLHFLRSLYLWIKCCPFFLLSRCQLYNNYCFESKKLTQIHVTHWCSRNKRLFKVSGDLQLKRVDETSSWELG